MEDISAIVGRIVATACGKAGREFTDETVVADGFISESSEKEPERARSTRAPAKSREETEDMTRPSAGTELAASNGITPRPVRASSGGEEPVPLNSLPMSANPQSIHNGPGERLVLAGPEQLPRDRRSRRSE